MEQYTNLWCIKILKNTLKYNSFRELLVYNTSMMNMFFSISEIDLK